MGEPIASPPSRARQFEILTPKMVEEINKTQDYMTLGTQPLDAVPAE